MKLLFEHADILTGDNDWVTLKNAYLGIEDNRIIYIGQNKPANHYDQVRDFRDHTLIPGLYNMHTHTPMAILRGLGSGLPLDRWLFEKMRPIEQKMTVQDAVSEPGSL